jgi:tRNA(fMet)-specific endonuclease VapC
VVHGPLYMLDTDTASHALRGRTPELDDRLGRLPRGAVCISAITRGELLYGLALKDGATTLARVIDAFLAGVTCLPWDESAATQFATVAAAMHRAGTPIGTMDTLIAGHAKAVGAVLVTRNTRHFKRIAELRSEDWIGSGAPKR